jgi:hypothetical protein
MVTVRFAVLHPDSLDAQWTTTVAASNHISLLPTKAARGLMGQDSVTGRKGLNMKSVVLGLSSPEQDPRGSNPARTIICPEPYRSDAAVRGAFTDNS